MSSHGPRKRLRELRHGDHVCMLYNNRTEQVAAAASVIKEGLISADRCVYVGGKEVLEEIDVALANAGVEVQREQARQRLLLLTENEAHLRHGRFDPHEMIEFLRQSEKQAVADGFCGLRVVGDMSWALGPAEGGDRVIEYESLLNHFYPNSRVLAICQYDRQHFSPETIGCSLRTHPLAILDDQVCCNFYYEPPELFGEGGKLQMTSQRVDWMVSQLRFVDRKLAESNRLEDELRMAKRRKSEFLAMLAHELRNTLERQSGQAIINVHDTGTGIEPEFLPSVFELFSQSARSPDRPQGGLGIGLTLVQHVVGLHGGTVSAHSEGLGHGSTFVVQLPLAEPSTENEHAVAEPSVAQGRRALIVDDHEGTAWVISKLLKKFGDHEIVTAHDGHSALAKARQLHPEIVLLDIGLPGMNGWDVGRALRSDPAFRDVLLIALTAYGQKEDYRKSEEAGFDEHLVKPPSMNQMKSILAHPKLSQRNE